MSNLINESVLNQAHVILTYIKRLVCTHFVSVLNAMKYNAD